MVRSYDPARPVPRELLDRILSAALRAPSAGHTQGVSFLVLSEPVDRDTYWTVTARPGEPDRWLRGMRTAPVLVLVWTSAEAYLDRYARPDKAAAGVKEWPVPFWYVDTGMAALCMLLTAVDEGLGACLFGIQADQREGFKREFGVPEEYDPVGGITVGYRHPDLAPQDAVSIDERRRRKEDVVHRGQW